MVRRRARWVPLFNAVAAPVLRRRSTSRTLAAIEAAAARQTGIEQPVDEPYRADMAVLVESFLAVDDLTPLGYLGLRENLTKRWANRLWIGRLLERHPEVADEPITAPIVVVGLPRTGTTYLHRLLTRQPGMRGPLLWEALAPRPAGDPDGDAARRRQAAERMARMASRVAPALQVAHSLRADGPEEDFFLLPHHLAWHNWAPMPDYCRWYAARDATDDYAYLRRQLQVLQWGSPPRQWVLKTPFHLWKLDVLLATFPDATIVWMHRDPAAALPSWCSFSEISRLVNLRTVDPEPMGAEFCALWREALTHGLRVRDAAPTARFVDIRYEELVADPGWVVDRILTAAGRPPSPTPVAPDRRRPEHRYRGDRYGLTDDGVRATFAAYLERFPLAL